MKKLLLRIPIFILFIPIHLKAQKVIIEKDSVSTKSEIRIQLLTTDSAILKLKYGMSMFNVEINSKRMITIGSALNENGQAAFHLNSNFFPVNITISTNYCKPIKIRVRRPGDYKISCTFKCTEIEGNSL